MATMATISSQGVDDDSVQKDTMNSLSTIKDDTFAPKAEVGLAEYSVKYILQDVPGTSAEKMSISADTQCSFPTKDETKISIAVDATHEDIEGVKDDSFPEHSVKEISHSKKTSISNETLSSSHFDSIKTMKEEKILVNDMVQINHEGEVMNVQFDIDKQEEEVTCTREDVGAKQTSDSGSPLRQLNLMADLEQVTDPLFEGTNIKMSLDGEDCHSKSTLENAMRFDVHVKDAEYDIDKEDEMCDIELSKNIEDTVTSKPGRMVDNKDENVIVVEQNSEKKSIYINRECNNTSQAINPVETSQCLGPCTDNVQIKSILTGPSNDTAVEIQACLREEEIKRSQQKTNENSSIPGAENDVNVEDLLSQCSEPNQLDGNELNKQNLAPPVGKLLSNKQDQNSDVCDVSPPQSDATLPKVDATFALPSMLARDTPIGVENDVPINKNCNAVYSESNQCNRDESHIQKIYSPSEENPLSSQQQQSDVNLTFVLPSMEAGYNLIGVEKDVPIDKNSHAMYAECTQRDECHKEEISSPPEDDSLSNQQKESDVDVETVLLSVTKETKQQNVSMEEAMPMENSSHLTVRSEDEVAMLPTTVFLVNENNEPFLSYSPNVIQNVDAKVFPEHEMDVGKYSTVEKPLSNNVADSDSEKHNIDNGEQTKVENYDHVMKCKQIVESLSCNKADLASQKHGNDDEEKPKGETDLYEMESKQYPVDKIYDETEGDEFSYEAEEDNSVERKEKPCNETEAFRIGDLVWAKVKSHPWWPAQIFDPSNASKSAMKVRKGGRLLVAFFGDCTFAWLTESQIIPFRSNFEEKVKQTTMKSFCNAVDEALEEVCRRSALALASKCNVRIPYSRSTFPDANAGIQKALRIQSHLDVSSSVHMFKAEKTLEYLKSIACSPFGASNSALEVAELCGHVYGFRTLMVPSEHELDGGLLLDSLSGRKSHESNLKRKYSSLESTGDNEGRSCETDAEQFPSCPGFEVIKKFKSVEPPELRDAGVMEIKGHEGMEKVKGTKVDVSNKLNKISKFGDSMKKVAGELTGSLPLAKCVGKSSSKRMKSTSKKHLACVPSSKDISLMQLYDGLDLSARDPLNSSGMNLIQDRVIEAFLRFRKIVFKKSSGYSGEKTKKSIKHPKQGHGVSPKNTTAYPHVSYRNDGADLQELAIVARKRKSEIVQQDVKKKAKTSPTPFSSAKHDFESFINAENPIEPRRFDKDIIKYSRRPAAPSPELKSSVQLHYDEKLSSRMPLGLFMKFPQDFELPSESELKDKFVSFGPLQSSGIRIDTDSASVQVAFEHGRDAELAWKHAKKNPMFGQVDVNYRLRHISPESSKAETKMNISSFNRDNSLKVVKPTSRVSKEVIQSSSKHSTNTEDRKRTLVLASKEAKDSSAKHLRNAGDVKSNDNMPNEVSNDVTKLQEPTGDIQDQMMTLLRQVSVIVGIPDATQG